MNISEMTKDECETALNNARYRLKQSRQLSQSWQETATRDYEKIAMLKRRLLEIENEDRKNNASV